MATTEILYAVQDGVAVVTLNRPDKLNAWTSTMEREVREAMRMAADDAAVRVIVLTGAGRGFCAGADMDTLVSVQSSGQQAPRAAAPQPFDPEARPDFTKTYSYFPTVPKPIIAAVNGACAGLGLVISLYADMRFASEDAVFLTAFARRGLIAEHGISWLLPRVVGMANAADLLFSSRRVTAQEAKELGLVNKVFSRDAFHDGVMGYAAHAGARGLAALPARDEEARSGTRSSRASARRSTAPIATWWRASPPRTSRKASPTLLRSARRPSPAGRGDPHERRGDRSRALDDERRGAARRTPSSCAAPSMPSPNSGSTAEDHRQGEGGARRPAARDARGPVDHRPRRHPARPGQRAHRAAARRHGRAAAARGHRPRRSPREHRGRDARLRPRHPRRHAGRRRPGAVRAARPADRHGDVHVPAGRGRLARRALHARGRAARSRCRTRPSRCTSRPTCRPACSPAAPARCSPRPTSSRSRSPARAATPRCRTTTIDPMPIACEIVMALQTLVTRRRSPSDPVVVTIAQIEAAPPTTSSPRSRDAPGAPSARSSSASATLAARGHRAGRRRTSRSAHGAEAEVEIIDRASRSPSATAASSTSPRRTAHRPVRRARPGAPCRRR